MLRKLADELSIRTANTLIGAHTRLTGEVRFTGAMRIEGNVAGDVIADEGDRDARLEIARSAVISGNVSVPVVVVHGTVEGDICSARRVILGGRAVVQGAVAYQELEMAVGATVGGELTRRPDVDRDHGAGFFEPAAEISLSEALDGQRPEEGKESAS